MPNFLEYKNAVLKVFEDSISFAKKAEDMTCVENIREIGTRLAKKEMVVVVCGEIKRGKSSLLSAFLEEKDLFPIDVNVATNTVTVIRYGEVEKVEVIFEADDKYDVKRIDRNQIAEFVTEQGNRKNEKRVKCLSIELPNSKLKDGFVFVDTPGVGSLNIEHSEVTYGYLPNADVLLFVSDALSPLTEPELKFLKSATKYCKNVIYPLTKIDKIAAYKDIMDTNIKKISQYTGAAENEIKVVPVSSLAKLKYIETKNPMMLKSSNYKVLEDEIWKLLYEKRAEILLMPPLAGLAREMSTIRNNLKIKYASLTQDNEIFKEMEANLKKTMEEKQRFLDEGAEWKGQLSHDLSVINSDIVFNIQNKQSEFETLIAELVKTKDASKRLQSMTEAVNNELLTLTLEVKNQILDNVVQLAERTEEKLGLSIDVNSPVIDEIAIEVGEVEITSKNSGFTDKAITVGRSMAMKGSGGLAISGLIGGLVGGAVGFFMGGPAGALIMGQQGAAIGGAAGGAFASGKGFFDGLKQLNNEDIPQITQAFNKYVNKKLQDMKSMVNSTMKELSFSLTNELNKKIKNQKAVLDKNINDIQESLKLNKADAVQKANNMKPLFELLNTIEARIKTLLSVTVKENIPKGEDRPLSDGQRAKTNNAEACQQSAACAEKKSSGKVSLDFLEE